MAPNSTNCNVLTESDKVSNCIDFNSDSSCKTCNDDFSL